MENNPWTSIDLYYKGVHIKKSMPEEIKPEELKKGIDAYLEAGFKPSWNEDTNNQNGHTTQTTIPAVTEDLGKCEKCGAPNFKSKKGNIVCSRKCWLTIQP
jgi:hypothetical protein